MIAEVREEIRRADPAGPRTVVLVGLGGIGKTAVALAVGHELLGDFADGQLFADLRGMQDEPVDSHAVLGRFLRALGVSSAEVPEDRDERLAAYRSHLAGRRMLLVLDDAAAEEQVRPLLPPAGGSATIVTSRRQLGALGCTARWTVPALAPEDALRLLARIAGSERIAAEPAAAGDVVEACGHSPLAICVAAGRLAVRRDWSIAEFRRRLTVEHGRLDALSVGDLDVRASIGLSYRALGPSHQLLFRRLGLLWAPEWPAWVADELAERSADPLLDELVNLHLVEPVGVDTAGQQRFRLHDLVADFARERALREDPDGDRDRVIARLLTAWLALAGVADDGFGHGYEFGKDLPVGPVPPRAVATVQATPADWFEVERANLIAAVGHACRSDRGDLAGGLALRLAGFLRVRGYPDERTGTLRAALAVARASGQDRLWLRLAQALFSAYVDSDRDAEVPALTAELLTVASALGERDLEIRALQQAALYAKRRGRLTEAIELYEQAIVAASSADASLLRLTSALSGAATVHTEAGRPELAEPLSTRAVAIQRTAGAPFQTAMRLLTHADVLADLGHDDAVEDALTEALTIFRTTGHEGAAAFAENRLGDLAVRRGRWTEAGTLIGRACAEFERLGDWGSAAYALRSLADLALARDRPGEAIGPLRRALQTWQRLRLPLEEARIHARIDRALTLLGDPEARRHRAECHRILLDLGLDERCLRLRTVSPTIRATRQNRA
ncbi:NB-ARC domain-containing protein [Hamadaea sp. NPDC050747]|uniref:ATP-binding protein n=1 Tax=Hamadaea sp. NPDC050747 TaxID=3155789 RepID=UPI0033F884F8